MRACHSCNNSLLAEFSLCTHAHPASTIATVSVRVFERSIPLQTERPPHSHGGCTLQIEESKPKYYQQEKTCYCAYTSLYRLHILIATGRLPLALPGKATAFACVSGRVGLLAARACAKHKERLFWRSFWGREDKLKPFGKHGKSRSA